MHLGSVYIPTVWRAREVLSEEIEHSTFWRSLEVLFDVRAILRVWYGSDDEINAVSVAGLMADVFERILGKPLLLFVMMDQVHHGGREWAC